MRELHAQTHFTLGTSLNMEPLQFVTLTIDVILAVLGPHQRGRGCLTSWFRNLCQLLVGLVAKISMPTINNFPAAQIGFRCQGCKVLLSV